MAQLAPYFNVVFPEAPLGRLHTYSSGTTTPKQTWQDQAGTVAHALPTAGVPLSGITLDAYGRPPGGFFIATSGDYTFHLYTAAGSLIKTWDDNGVSSERPVQREKQTATEGQTLFTLTGITYTAGINSLAVYVNGMLLPQADYTETSSTSVTLASGRAAGDEVEFVAGSGTNSLSALDAAVIPYVPAGTGAVNSNVQAKLREWISTADFDDDIDAWLTHLCANGGVGVVPAGTYTLAAGVTAALNASCSVVVSSGAKFVAGVGFPTGQRMFLISTGTGSNHTFRWEGGQFDATNQPNSGASESNDIFSFNAENCAHCKIILDRTTAGADWLTSGSDSHLFIGGARNVHAEIGHCLGAVDAGIYISSSVTGSIGNSLYAKGNFEKCNVGIIVKRLFETWTIDANVTDCVTGVGGGSADNGSGVTIAPGDGCQIRVNALRTERPCSLQAVAGGRVDVQAIQLGVSVGAYTSTSAKGLYLSGASKVTGVVNVAGVNASCTKGTGFRAVDCDRRTLDATNYDATDNLLIINCDDVGKAFAEDANSARNFFIVKENNVTAGSTLTGTNSSMHRANPSSSGFEMDEPVLSLAGLRGAEALRVLKTAGQVNFVQITGATAGAGSGVQVQAQGTDTNIPITLATKGTGSVLIGGAAGAESLRATKVASQVNAVDVTGSIAGAPVEVKSRGSDTNVDLQLTPKGSGAVRFGTHSALAAETVTGYITVKDAAGNTRKLAVVS